jgi:hypothetical protein
MRKLLILAIAMGTALGLGLMAGGGRAAVGSGPSYELGDFHVQYPFVTSSGQVDESLAGVAYSVRWTDGYPGGAQCTITLSGDDGIQVGQKVFRLDSGEPSVPAHATYEPVEVSAPPTTAQGACESGDLQGDAGYVFGSPEITSAGDSVAKITYPVSWSTDSPPGQRICEVEVTRSDGSTYRQTISIYRGKPHDSVSFWVPVAADSVADVTVHCSLPE